MNVFYLNEPIESTSQQQGRLEAWSGDDIMNAIRFNEHLLPNRLVTGEITALYGEPKVGKTFVAISCGLMAAIGGKFWNEDFPKDGCRVIYVAAERREQAAIRINAACIANGLDSIPEDFTLVERQAGLRLNDAVAMAQLREKIRTINPELVIFDTYVRMVDNDEDKASDADRNIEILTNLLRESSRPCAGILVHHSGKDITRKMRGSNALLAAVTSVWKLVRSRSSGVITLSMEDANSFAAPEPCHFTIETFQVSGKSSFDEVQEMGVAIPSGGPPKSTKRESRIYSTMGKYPLEEWRIENVIDALSALGETISRTSADRALQNLVDEGQVTRRKVSKAFVYRIVQEMPSM